MNNKNRRAISDMWGALLVIGAIAMTLAGCGDSDSHATKLEEQTFRDRDPSHIHGVPAGFRGHSGPPPGALAGPPPGAGGPPPGAGAPPAGSK